MVIIEIITAIQEKRINIDMFQKTHQTHQMAFLHSSLYRCFFCFFSKGKNYAVVNGLMGLSIFNPSAKTKPIKKYKLYSNFFTRLPVSMGKWVKS